jgi:hypothetical protein
MNNQLLDSIRLDSMTPEQLNALSMMTLQTLVHKLSSRMERVEDEHLKTKAEVAGMKAGLEEAREDSAKALQIAINAMRVREPLKGWMNLGEMGRSVTPSISSVRMGKLLRVVGIAKRSSSKTTPYQEYIGPEKLVRVEVYDTASGYKWNFKRVFNHINVWLEKNGYLEQFYSTETEDDRARLIDRLHYQYVEKKSEEKVKEPAVSLRLSSTDYALFN